VLIGKFGPDDLLDEAVDADAVDISIDERVAVARSGCLLDPRLAVGGSLGQRVREQVGTVCNKVQGNCLGCQERAQPKQFHPCR
jgi:hypothetical protein